MRKKLQKYLSGDHEGFSLVELIIVIAIMAILIGIVALAVIPYLEKSRVSKDKQTTDTVYSAFQTSLANMEVTTSVKMTITSSGVTVDSGLTASTNPKNTDFIDDFCKNLGSQAAADAAKSSAGKLSSKNGKGKNIVCEYDSATGEITAYVNDTAAYTDGLISSSSGDPKKKPSGAAAGTP